MRGRLKHRQRGASLAGTLIALPVLGLIVGITLQLGLLFQAKATLNHAVLQAARAGMVDNASEESLELGLARGMLPLFSPPEDLVGVGRTLVCDVTPEIITNTCIRIVNPTPEAFEDFAELEDGEEKIPNDELHRRPTTIGAVSGVNVQDANLLKVYVEYGVPMRIPVVGPLIANTLLASGQFSGGFEQAQLLGNRLPVVATATVRMQSAAIENRLMLTRAELQTGEYCASSVGATIETLRCVRDEVSKASFDAFLKCLRDGRQGALVGVIIGGVTGPGSGAGVTGGAVAGAVAGCIRGAIRSLPDFGKGLLVCLAPEAREVLEELLRRYKCA